MGYAWQCLVFSAFCSRPFLRVWDKYESVSTRWPFFRVPHCRTDSVYDPQTFFAQHISVVMVCNLFPRSNCKKIWNLGLRITTVSAVLKKCAGGHKIMLQTKFYKTMATGFYLTQAKLSHDSKLCPILSLNTTTRSRVGIVARRPHKPSMSCRNWTKNILSSSVLYPITEWYNLWARICVNCLSSGILIVLQCQDSNI